jgi:DNA-binding protein HU-beta
MEKSPFGIDRAAWTHSVRISRPNRSESGCDARICFDSRKKLSLIAFPIRAIPGVSLKTKGVPKAMNKQDLISAVAETSGLSKTDAGKAVESVFDSITGALKKGDEVRLVGFGTFSVSNRKASTGRNPRTGEAMTIKASSQPKFKAGKGLKDAVN